MSKQAFPKMTRAMLLLLTLFLVLSLQIVPAQGRPEAPSAEPIVLRSKFPGAQVEEILDGLLYDYQVFALELPTIISRIETGRLALHLDGQLFDLELKPVNLFAQDYRAVLMVDGVAVRQNHIPAATFQGTANGDAASVVRLTVTPEFLTGYIRTEKEWIFIDLLDKYSAAAAPSDVVVYGDADVRPEAAGECGALHLEETSRIFDLALPAAEAAHTTLRRLDIATDADGEYYQRYGSPGTLDRITAIINGVDGIYRSELNLYLRITFQQVWDDPDDDPYDNTDSLTRLNDFVRWWNNNHGSVNRDVAHLFSGVELDGNIVGRSYIATVCNDPALSYGISQDLTPICDQTQLLAHEVGHNLAAMHDDVINCSGVSCNDSGPIMCSSIQSNSSNTFSSCSHTDIDDHIHNNGSCLDSDVPSLEIRDWNDVELSSGATLSWGTFDYGVENNQWGGWRYLPVARNNATSGSALALSWQLVHSQGSGFSMGGNGLASSLAPGTEDSFVLRLHTTIPGTHQAQLLITHNDVPQPNPFVINLEGTVRAEPQFQVSRSTNVLTYDETLSLGSFGKGSGTKSRGITVKNVAATGASGLEWGPVQVTNTQGAAFSWSGVLVSPLSPGTSDNFAVNFDTSTAGSYRALVEVWHNDPVAINPHRFYVEVTVTPPQTVEFPAIADAFVDQTQPAINWGSYPYLYVRSTLSGQGKSTYLKFSVSGLQGVVQSATLRIQAATFLATSRLYWLQTTSWAENTITWQNAPLDMILQRPLGGVAQGMWQEIDVTDIVQGNGLYTLGLTSGDQPSQAYYSRESGSVPTLVVTYQP